MLKIGIIGLDTSHMVRFAELLNGADSAKNAYNAKVTCAFAGGSPGFNLSTDRLANFTRVAQEDCGVTLVESIDALPENLDAIMIGSVDARQHLEQYRAIAPRGLPVFINKPLAISNADAQAMDALSQKWNSPLLSASGMRFTEALTTPLRSLEPARITGADVYCPMEIIPELPGYFWYGIHAVEMAYRIMGSGCQQVRAEANEHTDTLTAHWADGRVVTLRGQRTGNTRFGGTIHLQDDSCHFQVGASHKPFYVSQLDAILEFFKTRQSCIPAGQTLEIIRFMQAANASRANGQCVAL